MNIISTLDRLEIRKKALIKEINNDKDIRRRLLDMGFIPNALVECVMISPLNDPVAYKVRDAIVALRREDSKNIVVEVLK